MTTYYDPRAQRAVAGAEAERARAEAEATRTETMLRLEAVRAEQAARQAEQARRERLEREHSRSARRAERRRQRAEARAARRAALRRGAGALAAAVVTRASVLVGGVAMSAPIAIAWNGQLAFAKDIMHLGLMAPALPIALEGGVWYLAFLVHRAIKARLPIGRYRLATWAMAGIAASMNLWHGITANKVNGAQVGAILALASLLGIALWELTASLTQQTTSRRTATEIRRAAWRRIRYPRLSWSAASIRASRGEGCSIEEAWTAAWIDRYGVGPAASRRDRKLARSIVRYQRRADRAAARSGELSIVDGSIVRPGMPPSPQAAQEAEEAMARLRAFSERRDDVARSIAFPSIGSQPIESIESIQRPPAPVDAAAVAAPVDRVASIEESRSTSAPASIESPRSTAAESIVRPRRSIEARSARQAPATRSIDADADAEEPTPRRSIEEHRAALREAIAAGEIDPQEATAEGIRKFLHCAPKTAQALRDELRTEVAA